MMQLSLMNSLRGRSSTTPSLTSLVSLLPIPHIPLKYELIDWEVIDSCLNRIEYLNTQWNCYADPLITNSESCTANGKIIISLIDTFS